MEAYEKTIKLMESKTPYTRGVIHDNIVKIKVPLLTALVVFSDPSSHSKLDMARALKGVYDILPLVKTIPTPSRETCRYQNSKLLCDIRDNFIEYSDLGDARNKGLIGIINGFIIIYEYDPPYRHRIDWWIEKIVRYIDTNQWLPGQTPQRNWKER